LSDLRLHIFCLPTEKLTQIRQWQLAPSVRHYIIKREILTYTILSIVISLTFSQNKKLQNNKIDRKLQFATDSLNGIYIPENIEDCIKQIDGFWDDTTKTKMKNLSEKEFTARTHLGFGMWMRNNWGLWSGSRLSKYFNKFGINHPDDISGIILTSYHRHLNNKEIQLNEQIQYFKDYWEELKKKQEETRREEFSAFNINDTVYYKYHLGFVSEKQEDKFYDISCIAKGVVKEKNNQYFSIKVLLIESCDNKGIIYYDNKNMLFYNPKTATYEKGKKRIIKRMKIAEENWFDFQDWEKNE